MDHRKLTRLQKNGAHERYQRHNTSSTVSLRGVGVSDVGGIRIIGVWVEGSHFRLTGDRVETPKLVVLHQHWHESQLPWG